MDDCESCGLLTSEYMISSQRSHADLPSSKESNKKNISMNDLESGLTLYLKMDDNQNASLGLTTAVMKNDTSLVKEDNSNDLKLECSTCKKLLEKSATFPCYDEAASSGGSVNVREEAEIGSKTDILTCNVGPNSYIQPFLQRCASLPTPLSPVSALKGSREKQGKPTQKLTVTWAPDVYDPIPTSVSLVPSQKAQQRRKEGKRNGNYMQKSSGKPSRSSSRGKGKKRSRKGEGYSDKGTKSRDNDWPVSSSEPSLNGDVKLNLGKPPNCGSFLKKSVTPFHFSVAEAK